MYIQITKCLTINDVYTNHPIVFYFVEVKLGRLQSTLIQQLHPLPILF